MKFLKFACLLMLLSFFSCDDDEDPIAPATCSDGIQNGDETGIDCGGSCTACEVTCSDEVSFSASGLYGANLLMTGSDTVEVTSSGSYSLAASKVESCTSLEIVLTLISEDSSCPDGCWYYFPDMVENWTVGTYNTSTASQTFTSTGTDMDMILFDFGQGIYQIDYYVNDDLTHSSYIKAEGTTATAEEYMTEVSVITMIESSGKLYMSGIDEMGLGYYGIIDPNDLESGFTEKHSIGEGHIAIEGNTGYFYDFEASALIKVDLTAETLEADTLKKDFLPTFHMTVHGDDFYFATLDFETFTYAIYQFDLSTPEGDPVLMIDGVNVSALKVANDKLYYSSYTDIYSMDLTVESPVFEPVISFGMSAFITAITITDDYIYYSNSGSISRIDLTNMESEDLLLSNSIYDEIYVSESYLLFSDALGAVIYKMDLMD